MAVHSKAATHATSPLLGPKARLMGLDVAICDEGLAPWATSAGKTVRTQVRNAVVASTRGRRGTNLMVPKVGRALSVGG